MRHNTYIIVISVVSVLIFASCKQHATQETEKEVSKVKVRVSPIEKSKVQSTVRCTGMLSSKSEAKLSFKTGGVIKRIFVEEGSAVKKGQILAQLNLSEIQAKVDQAKEGLKKSRRDFERSERLFKDSLITKELYDNAGSALEFAKSNVQIAEFNLRYSTIKAPSNGKILKRLFEQDEVIGPGYPVFLFGSSDIDWVMRSTVSDKDIVGINEGDSAYLFFDAYPGDTLKAVVSETASMSDPYTGTYEVEMSLKRSEHKLVSGLIAKGKIFMSNSEEFYMIPLVSIVETNNNQIKVFCSSGDSVQKLTLDVEKHIGEYLYVRSGLDTNSFLIVSGAGYLDEGSIIEIVK